MNLSIRMVWFLVRLYFWFKVAEEFHKWRAKRRAQKKLEKMF